MCPYVEKKNKLFLLYFFNPVQTPPPPAPIINNYYNVQPPIIPTPPIIRDWRVNINYTDVIKNLKNTLFDSQNSLEDIVRVWLTPRKYCNRDSRCLPGWLSSLEHPQKIASKKNPTRFCHH